MLAYGLRRLGALRQPVLCPFRVDFDLRGISNRVVLPENLQESPIARPPLLDNHDPVKGTFLRPYSGQTHSDQTVASLLLEKPVDYSRNPAGEANTQNGILEPFHPFPEKAALHGLHHFLGLDVLLQKLIHFLDTRAAALGDPFAAAPIDDLMVPRSFGVMELMMASVLTSSFSSTLAFCISLKGPTLGSMLRICSMLPSFLNLPELVAEVLQRESCLFPEGFQRLLLVYDFLAFSISDMTSPIPMIRDSEPVGMEHFQCIVLFPDTDEFHRLSGHLLDRKSRAAPGIAVHLRQDESVEAELFVELLGALDRVLSEHCVCDEQDFVRPDVCL